MAPSIRVIGMMSGTSLDGMDLACVRFWQQNDRWQFAIEAADSQPYSTQWVERLRNGLHTEGHELDTLDLDFSLLVAERIQAFIAQFELSNVDFVSSHGHTLKHRPQEGYTLQIGNRPLLAGRLQLPVVCDFRVQDVAFGGQGAPLVPIGDRLLFGTYDACLNLGGFSNISFETNQNAQKRRLAFDCSPVNTVLNTLIAPLGLPYDNGGNVARQGKVHADLLTALNQLPYYQQGAPKSLGVEWLNQAFYPILARFLLSIPDQLATVVEHIAQQIAATFPIDAKCVLVTGGGAYHQYLMERMQAHAPNTKLHVPDNQLLEFKEALIFAFLGLLRWQNQINVLASVTGASHEHSSGQIYLP
ncbi:MAG: anhydro-N-acetylmuramic acid kinase [Flavobacterium sp. BFFFF2]|nr:MAG: anhydro-N-acetylmuramic acid kinase [Flavobacterium sp. BFFFF2]